MRKSTPRSKTGCLNCRKRKVRCGEEKPMCKRCFQHGSSECIQSNVALSAGSGGSFHTFSVHHNGPPSDSIPTHQTRIKEILNSEKPSASHGLSTPLSRNPLWPQELQVRDPNYHGEITKILSQTTPSPQITFQIPGTEDERRLFQYFRAEALPEICGYSNFSFWDSSLLSWSHEQPVLRYAIVALASFHENQKINPKIALLGVDQNPISLRHYNKAIKAVQNLITASSKPTRQMVLTCCLLFYVIEGIRGGYETGVKHLKAGLAILDETSAPNMDSELGVLLAAYDISYSYMNNTQKPSLVLTTPKERSGEENFVPSSFSDIQAARSIGIKLTNWAYHFLLAVGEQYPKAPEKLYPSFQQELRSLLLATDQVDLAITTLRKHYITQAITQRIYLRESIASIAAGIRMLRLRITFNSKMTELASYHPSTDADVYFNEILFLVETLTEIYTMNTQGPQKLEPRSFFLVQGIVSTVIMLTLSTRDTSVRKRGLKVMKKWPKAPGTPETIYDGDKIALAIESLTIEEGLNVLKHWPRAPGMSEAKYEEDEIAFVTQAAAVDAPTREPKDTPYGRTITEVLSSISRRSFLGFGGW